MTTLKTKEEVFDIIAGRKMRSWGLAGFKRVFPTLYGVIIDSMQEYNAHVSGSVGSDLLNEKKKVIVLSAALEKVKHKVTYTQKHENGRIARLKSPQEVYGEITAEIDRALITTK